MRERERRRVTEEGGGKGSVPVMFIFVLQSVGMRGLLSSDCTTPVENCTPCPSPSRDTASELRTCTHTFMLAVKIYRRIHVHANIRSVSLFLSHLASTFCGMQKQKKACGGRKPAEGESLVGLTMLLSLPSLPHLHSLITSSIQK